MLCFHRRSTVKFAKSKQKTFFSVKVYCWFVPYLVRKKINKWLASCSLLVSFPRTWRVQTKMSTLVVQICTHILDLELFSILDKIQKACLFYCNGSFCRSCYYHLHSFKHNVYGYGASPNDWWIQKCTHCGKFGEFLNVYYVPINLFGCHDCHFFSLSQMGM